MKAWRYALGAAVILSACSTRHSFEGRPIKLGQSFSALVFSKTAGFRHDSIPNGIKAITELGKQNGFRVDATENSSLFTDENLANYQVVIFLCTTRTILNDNQKAAFQRYIEGGNGFVGIHSATDTEYDWEWYGRLVGAYFSSHPSIQGATVLIEDSDHPSTASLPKQWQRTDEWYNFQSNPRGAVRVLARMDESTYNGGKMGDDHPIAWCHDVKEGGRSWYTALGHTQESYGEPLFRKHLLGGILSAAGATPANCTPR